MAQHASPEWLKEELAKALGWDAMWVEGVVHAIGDAGSQEEIQEIVKNYMANDPKAASVIDTFLAARSGGSQTTAAPTALAPLASRADAATSWRSGAASAPASSSQLAGDAAAARASYASSIRAVSSRQEPSTNTGSAEAGWKVLSRDDDESKYAVSSSKSKSKGKKSSDASPRIEFGDEAGTSSRQPEKALGMFKQGGRAPRGSKAGSSSSSRSKEEQVASLERKVVNCLCCGKVYDCRNMSSDILRFLDRGGACTFCGAMVALSYQDKSEERPANRAAAAGAAAAEDATAKAVAFKDRLVDYDRNSAKRTTVIDDQSDYFEVNSSWLTEEERAELLRRQKQEEEAAEARRKSVTFAIDLLGRRVVVPEEAERLQQEREQQQAAAGGKGGAKPGFAVPELPEELKAERAECGGGAAELQQTIAQLRNLKISACPTLKMPAPVFLPAVQMGQPEAASGSGKAAAAGSSKRPGGSQTAKSKGLTRSNIGRVQDDNIFDCFELEMERGGRAGTVLSAADTVFEQV